MSAPRETAFRATTATPTQPARTLTEVTPVSATVVFMETALTALVRDPLHRVRSLFCNA